MKNSHKKNKKSWADEQEVANNTSDGIVLFSFWLLDYALSDGVGQGGGAHPGVNILMSWFQDSCVMSWELENSLTSTKILVQQKCEQERNF